MSRVPGRLERLESRSFFDELLTLRDEQRQERETAELVVSPEEVPWELNRHGLMKWYMAPTMDDIVMKTYIMYLQRIPAGSRTGKQLTQGQQLGFVWHASAPGGHSIIDGVRFEWARWDVIQVPLRPRGCVVQHFNDSDDDIEIMFTSLNHVYSAGVDRGAGFEQIDDCPEWRQHQREAEKGK